MSGPEESGLMSYEYAERWQNIRSYEKGQLASNIFSYVSEVERTQSVLFERFFRLSSLYDPYFAALYGVGNYGGYGGGGGWFGSGDLRVTENVIASNVDTVVSIIAPSKVRPRFLTDDGDWTTKRQAARLSWYAEGLGKQIGIHDECVLAFKDAALKGTGIVKVWVDWYEQQIKAKRILVDDIIVDEAETRTGGRPRQMHFREFANRDELKAAYPECADEIEQAQRSDTGYWELWADYRTIEREQVVAIESWYLPIGKKGSKGYRPGRHVISVDRCELVDEEWPYDYFPFAVMKWTDRAVGWYGIGGAERISGHQRRLNKMHWQVDRRLDLGAMPTTYVHQADAKLAVLTRNEFGTIGVYKERPPETVIAPAVSGETYQRLERIKEGSFEEFGVSRLAATARKPAGIESGVALREYRDQTTQRFALQEIRFENLVLDCMWLSVAWAKAMAEHGVQPPTVIKKLARGRKKINWPDVDTGEARVQLYAAATLGRTPAGRTQTAVDWAAANIISKDEARKLMGPFDSLDLEATISLYQAAMDDIDRVVESILEGDQLVPEPFQNLELGVRRMEQAYLIAKGDEAPEEVLDSMRMWMDTAAMILNPPAPPEPMVPGAGMVPEPMPAQGAMAIPSNEQMPPPAGAPPAPGPGGGGIALAA